MTRELIRETEWNRIYRISNAELRWESRFLDPGFAVSAAAIRNRWHNLTSDEQLDFSLAFAIKSELSEEDEKIVEFLMQVGDGDICSNIATTVVKLADKKKALSLLMMRIGKQQAPFSNYYAAISSLGDTLAVPMLQKEYERYAELLANADYSTIRDYAYCCKALFVLVGDEQYQTPLITLSESSDEKVANLARRLISQAY